MVEFTQRLVTMITFRHKFFSLMRKLLGTLTLKRDANSGLTLMYVTLHSTPTTTPLGNFFTLESTSQNIFWSSHLKLTLTALHCRYIKTLQKKGTLGVWMWRQGPWQKIDFWRAENESGLYVAICRYSRGGLGRFFGHDVPHFLSAITEIGTRWVVAVTLRWPGLVWWAEFGWFWSAYQIVHSLRSTHCTHRVQLRGTPVTIEQELQYCNLMIIRISFGALHREWQYIVYVA